MDSLSVAASIVAIVSGVQDVIRSVYAFSNPQDLSQECRAQVEDYRAFLRLIQEVERDVLTSDHSLFPSSAAVVLQRCAFQSDHIHLLLIKWIDKQRRRVTFEDKSTVLEVEKAISTFKTSVIILRQLTTDSAVHGISGSLRDMQEHIQRQTEAIQSLSDLVRGTAAGGKDILQKSQDSPQAATLAGEDESVHVTALGSGSILPTHLPHSSVRTQENHARDRRNFWQPGLPTIDISSPNLTSILNPNPTSTSLAIFTGVRDGEEKHIGAKCQFDTGCEDNWISHAVLKRGDISADMQPIPVAGNDKFVGFNNRESRPVGKITLTWFMRNAATARETDFLVAESGPFDVLLGRQFILSESLITVNEAVLPLRGPRISAAEQLQMEASSRLQQVESEHLEAAQRAREMGARRQRREQDAADTSSSSMSTGTDQGSSNSPVI